MQADVATLDAYVHSIKLDVSTSDDYALSMKLDLESLVEAIHQIRLAMP